MALKVTNNVTAWIMTAAVAVVMALGLGSRAMKEAAAKKRREEQASERGTE